ncbi:FKBP-type peptidyl-prolyl cis-trans isomerase [Mucilaginibacter sp. X5P1]|uniref:FKBP-type peptidyl-prolyl cis-trans isomerase n=1 Tax=Mucilaginibacter sp. X5P1 TaxID=2723088 RepID=UPI00160E13F8|nr:FKBP-type peptidyl-prolyl cis-trans isomerase [Mucilaginibacter sp. X5P1]MBB6141292.1 FKBP-type peptidyl-prolyl cis-trans isomerase [Mucilaginibacter sp. X5P1]
MKQTLFTLLLLSTIGLVSCKKTGTQPNIKQYDETQIQNYISANGISGMIKDTVGQDTTGIYYKILTSPKTVTTIIGDTSKISFVFTLKSFDGKYSSTDTIQNHYDGYVGHITLDALPLGLRLAILNNLKYRGYSMRILIPSHLAYGLYGYGSGSIENTSSRIAGNQCLDYYVHVINNVNGPVPDNQATYDDQTIQQYMKHENFTDYIKTSTGLYYKIITPGTGAKIINQNSTIESTYTGMLLNNIQFDSANNGADSVSLEVPDLIKGMQEGLTHATTGTLISMIIPSGLAYAETATTGVPVNSCLRFEFQVIDVTP